MLQVTHAYPEKNVRPRSGKSLHFPRLGVHACSLDIPDGIGRGNDKLIHPGTCQRTVYSPGGVVVRLVFTPAGEISHVDVGIEHDNQGLIRRICSCFMSTTMWFCSATLQKCSAGVNISPVSL